MAERPDDVEMRRTRPPKDREGGMQDTSLDESKKPRFEVGNVVRVEKYKPCTRFVKGYTINFMNYL